MTAPIGREERLPLAGASEPGAAPAATTPWAYRRSPAQLVRRAVEELRRQLVRWVVCRGNKIAYLRRLGVRIGSNCTVITGVKEFGTEPWLIELGARVSIANDVVFVTHDGATRVFRHRVPGASIFGNRFGPIRVLDDSFVGIRTILMPGVTIGPNSVVGAGSVVTRDVPPNSVAAGVPAKVLCTLDEYVESYVEKMVDGLSNDRAELRAQLTRHFWGEER